MLEPVNVIVPRPRVNPQKFWDSVANEPCIYPTQDPDSSGVSNSVVRNDAGDLVSINGVSMEVFDQAVKHKDVATQMRGMGYLTSNQAENIQYSVRGYHGVQASVDVIPQNIVTVLNITPSESESSSFVFRYNLSPEEKALSFFCQRVFNMPRPKLMKFAPVVGLQRFSGRALADLELLETYYSTADNVVAAFEESKADRENRSLNFSVPGLIDLSDEQEYVDFAHNLLNAYFHVMRQVGYDGIEVVEN
ncbi:MAG: hypothetical protein A3B68_00665 [Candidatus Melainabacteria bacterium RIFCSPHIGHO2_02_FULL_34_12]|nr:MAG: hypothetical protein A3B68_00665 [Candidatus Melainabacteria bacterium RIFCSPHIGHO2_02_FULL_34_12]